MHLKEELTLIQRGTRSIMVGHAKHTIMVGMGSAQPRGLSFLTQGLSP